MPSPLVAIFTHRPTLDWHEKISLIQCARVLARHPLHLVCPAGMDVSAYLALVPSLTVDRVPAAWMENLESYNRMKISPDFYDRYQGRYDFMLTYELDAFVFRNELTEWCLRGWDYIGAPWFLRHHSGGPENPVVAGGNSGFSLRDLRRVDEVSFTLSPIMTFKEVRRRWRKSATHSPRRFRDLVKYLWGNNFHYLLNGGYMPEDQYWSQYVPRRFPHFRVAPYQEARLFSFENQPQRLWDETKRRLPFGCHKWQEDHLDFWRPHIRAQGYDI